MMLSGLRWQKCESCPAKFLVLAESTRTVCIACDRKRLKRRARGSKRWHADKQVGRPRRYRDNAEKQSAYRERQKTAPSGSRCYETPLQAHGNKELIDAKIASLGYPTTPHHSARKTAPSAFGGVRLSLLAVLYLFLAGSALAQGAMVPPQVALQTVNGVTRPIPGATITVCGASVNGLPCSPPLVNAIFSNTALTQPLTNPFFADASGNYQFAIAPGTYTVTVTASGFGGYSYQITASCVVPFSCVATNAPNTWSQPQTYSAQIVSSVATGTAPFSIASTTVVPNLNVQLHNGLTAPASAIVGISDAQTLTNKNIAGSEINSGTVPSAQIPAINLAASGNGGVTGVLPGANMAATNLAGGNNPGGVTGVLPPANEGTGTPAAGKYVDGATGAWTALPTAATPTIAYKPGSGGGNYTGTNTTFAAVDTTNLCYSVTVPVGSKLLVTASGDADTTVAITNFGIALADAGATCTSGGTTVLNGTERILQAPATTAYVTFSMQYVLTGDGNAHSILLMAYTNSSNDAWFIPNASAAHAPAMTFFLTPSN